MQDQWRVMAETAIEDYEREGGNYAERAGVELDLEAERPMLKDAAIRRIMGEVNPLTDKPHSASSAEKIVEGDAEYRAHLHRQRETVVEKNAAFTRMTAARLRAEMAIALLRSHEAGVTA